jgi:hypothetical protein
MSYKRNSLHPVTGEPMTAVEYNELANIHGWESMPDWEAKLRDRLEKELPEGGYEIGSPNFRAWTGKGGKIECEVALSRAIKDLCKSEPSITVKKVVYKKLTYAEVREKIGDVLFPKDKK